MKFWEDAANFIRHNNSEKKMQRIIEYDNGYGASVIDFGYGSDRGLLELAVLHRNENSFDPKGDLCYRTPITDDVMGWLSEEDVQNILKQIEELPSDDSCGHSHEDNTTIE